MEGKLCSSQLLAWQVFSSFPSRLKCSRLKTVQLDGLDVVRNGLAELFIIERPSFDKAEINVNLGPGSRDNIVDGGD